MPGGLMNIEDKQAAFEVLLNEVSGALSDLVAVAKEGHTSMEEMASTLADMLGVMERRNEGAKGNAQGVAEIVAAIKAIRIEIPAVAPPQVTVKNQINVNPTPIEFVVHAAAPVVHVMERPIPIDYEMKIAYDANNRIDSVRLIASKGNSAGIVDNAR